MRAPIKCNYLEPTQSSANFSSKRGLEGSIVMLNLLKFREIADYSAHPELAPALPISGAEAFDRYIRHTLPFLHDSGGELLLLGAGGPFLIGPEDETWDMAMLVRQSSVASFLAFASHDAYLAGIGHRTAAVEDSRLLPLNELQPPASSEHDHEHCASQRHTRRPEKVARNGVQPRASRALLELEDCFDLPSN